MTHNFEIYSDDIFRRALADRSNRLSVRPRVNYKAITRPAPNENYFNGVIRMCNGYKPQSASMDPIYEAGKRNTSRTRGLNGNNMNISSYPINQSKTKGCPVDYVKINKLGVSNEKRNVANDTKQSEEKRMCRGTSSRIFSSSNFSKIKTDSALCKSDRFTRKCAMTARRSTSSEYLEVCKDNKTNSGESIGSTNDVSNQVIKVDSNCPEHLVHQSNDSNSTESCVSAARVVSSAARKSKSTLQTDRVEYDSKNIVTNKTINSVGESSEVIKVNETTSEKTYIADKCRSSSNSIEVFVYKDSLSGNKSVGEQTDARTMKRSISADSCNNKQTEKPSAQTVGVGQTLHLYTTNTKLSRINVRNNVSQSGKLQNETFNCKLQSSIRGNICGNLATKYAMDPVCTAKDKQSDVTKDKLKIKHEDDGKTKDTNICAKQDKLQDNIPMKSNSSDKCSGITSASKHVLRDKHIKTNTCNRYITKKSPGEHSDNIKDKIACVRTSKIPRTETKLHRQDVTNVNINCTSTDKSQVSSPKEHLPVHVNNSLNVHDYTEARGRAIPLTAADVTTRGQINRRHSYYEGSKKTLIRDNALGGLKAGTFDQLENRISSYVYWNTGLEPPTYKDQLSEDKSEDVISSCEQYENINNNHTISSGFIDSSLAEPLNIKLVNAAGSSHGKSVCSNRCQQIKTCYCLSTGIVLKDTNRPIVSEHSKAELDTSCICLCHQKIQPGGKLICQEKIQTEQKVSGQGIQTEEDKYSIKGSYQSVLDQPIGISANTDNPISIERNTVNTQCEKSARGKDGGYELNSDAIFCEMNNSLPKISSNSKYDLCNGSTPDYKATTGISSEDDLTLPDCTDISVKKVNKCSKSSLVKVTEKSVTASKNDDKNKIQTLTNCANIAVDDEITSDVETLDFPYNENENSDIVEVESVSTTDDRLYSDDIQNLNRLRDVSQSLSNYPPLNNNPTSHRGATYINGYRQQTPVNIKERGEICSSVSISSDCVILNTQNSANLSEKSKDGNSITTEKLSKPGKDVKINTLNQELDKSVKVSVCEDSHREIISHVGKSFDTVYKSDLFENYSAIDCYHSDAHANGSQSQLRNKGDENINICKKHTENCELIGHNGQDFTSKLEIDSCDQSASIAKNRDGSISGSNSKQMTKLFDEIGNEMNCNNVHMQNAGEQQWANDAVKNDDNGDVSNDKYETNNIDTKYSERSDNVQSITMDYYSDNKSDEYKSVHCDEIRRETDNNTTSDKCSQEQTTCDNTSINIDGLCDKAQIILDGVNNYPGIGLHQIHASSEPYEHRLYTHVIQTQNNGGEQGSQNTEAIDSKIDSDNGMQNKGGFQHTDNSKKQDFSEPKVSDNSDQKLSNAKRLSNGNIGNDKSATISKVNRNQNSTLSTQKRSSSKLVMPKSVSALQKPPSKTSGITSARSENITRLRDSKSKTPSPSISRKLSNENKMTSGVGKNKGNMVKVGPTTTDTSGQPVCSRRSSSSQITTSKTYGLSDKGVRKTTLKSEKDQNCIAKNKQSPSISRKTEKVITSIALPRTSQNIKLQEKLIKSNGVVRRNSKTGDGNKDISSAVNQSTANRTKISKFVNSTRKSGSFSSSPTRSDERASKSPSPGRSTLGYSKPVRKVSSPEVVTPEPLAETVSSSMPELDFDTCRQSDTSVKNRGKLMKQNVKQQTRALTVSESKLPTVHKKEKTPTPPLSTLPKRSYSAANVAQKKETDNTEKGKSTKITGISKNSEALKRTEGSKLSTSSLSLGTQKQKVDLKSGSKPTSPDSNYPKPVAQASSSLPRSRSSMASDLKSVKKQKGNSESSFSSGSTISPSTSRRIKTSIPEKIPNGDSKTTKTSRNSSQRNNSCIQKKLESKIPSHSISKQNTGTTSKKSVVCNESSGVSVISKSTRVQKSFDKSPVLQRKTGILTKSKEPMGTSKSGTIKRTAGVQTLTKLSQANACEITEKKQLTYKGLSKSKSIPRTSTPITRVSKTLQKQIPQKPEKLLINSNESARTEKIGIPTENITAVKLKRSLEIHQIENDGDKISEIKLEKIPVLSTGVSFNADVDKGDPNVRSSEFPSSVQNLNENNADSSKNRCDEYVTMELCGMNLNQTKEQVKSDQSHSITKAPETKNINKICEQNHTGAVTVDSDQYERNYASEMVQTVNQAIINDSETESSEEYWSLSEEESYNSNTMLNDFDHGASSRYTPYSQDNNNGQGGHFRLTLKHITERTKVANNAHEYAIEDKNRIGTGDPTQIIKHLISEQKICKQSDNNTQVADDDETEDMWCEAADDNINIEGGVLFSDNKSCNKKPFDLRSKNITHPPKFDSNSEVLNVNSTKLYEKDKKQYVSTDIEGKLPVLANLEEYVDAGKDKSEIQINEGSEGVSDSILVKNIFSMEDSSDRMSYLLSSHIKDSLHTDVDVLPHKKCSNNPNVLRGGQTTESQDYNNTIQHSTDDIRANNICAVEESDHSASKNEHPEEELNGISDKVSGTLCGNDLANDASLSVKHNISLESDLNHFESEVKHDISGNDEGTFSAEKVNIELENENIDVKSFCSDDSLLMEKHDEDVNVITDVSCAKHNNLLMDAPTDSNVSKPRRIVTRSQRSIKYETVTTKIVRHEKTGGNFATLEMCTLENENLPSDLVNKQSHIVQSSSVVASRIIDTEDGAKISDHAERLNTDVSSQATFSDKINVSEAGFSVASRKEIEHSDVPINADIHQKIKLCSSAENIDDARGSLGHDELILRELGKDECKTNTRSKVSIIKSTSNVTKTINVTVRSRNSSQIDSQCSSVKFSNSETLRFDNDCHGLDYLTTEGFPNTAVTNSDTCETARYDDFKVSNISVCDKVGDSKISQYSENNSEKHRSDGNRSSCNLKGITDLAVVSHLNDIKSGVKINENADNSKDLNPSFDISLESGTTLMADGILCQNKQLDNINLSKEKVSENLDKTSPKTDNDNLTSITLKINDKHPSPNENKCSDEISDNNESDTHEPQKSIWMQTLLLSNDTFSEITKASLLHNCNEEQSKNNGLKELASAETDKTLTECRLQNEDNCKPDVQMSSMPQPVIQITESKVEEGDKSETDKTEMQEAKVSSHPPKSSKRKERSRQELRRFTATVCLINRDEENDIDSAFPPQRPRARSKSPITLKTEISGVESKQSVTCMGNSRVSEICRTFIKKADKFRGAEPPLDKSRPTSPTVQSPAPGRKMKWVNNCGKWKRIPVDEIEVKTPSPTDISQSTILQSNTSRVETLADETKEELRETEISSNHNERESNIVVTLQGSKQKCDGTVSVTANKNKPKPKEPPKVLPKPSEEVRRKSLANVVTKWTSLGQKKVTENLPVSDQMCDKSVDDGKPPADVYKEQDTEKFKSRSQITSPDSETQETSVQTQDNFQYFKTLEIKVVNKPAIQKQILPKMLLKQDDGWKHADDGNENVNTNTSTDTSTSEMTLVSGQNVHGHTANQTGEQVQKKQNILSEVMSDKMEKKDEINSPSKQTMSNICSKMEDEADVHTVLIESQITANESESLDQTSSPVLIAKEPDVETTDLNSTEVKLDSMSQVPENTGDEPCGTQILEDDLYVEYNITLVDTESGQGMDISNNENNTENDDKSTVDDDITPTNTPSQKLENGTENVEVTPTNTPKLKAVKIKQEIFPREDSSSQNEPKSVVDSNVKFYIEDDSSDDNSKENVAKPSNSSKMKCVKTSNLKSDVKLTKDIKSFGYSSYRSMKIPEDYSFPKFSQYGESGKNARRNILKESSRVPDTQKSKDSGQRKLLSEIVELEETNRKTNSQKEVQRQESTISSAELESTANNAQVKRANNRSQSLPAGSLSVQGQNRIVYKNGHFVIETGLEDENETEQNEESDMKNISMKNVIENEKNDRKDQFQNTRKWKSSSATNLCDNSVCDDDGDVFLGNEGDVTVIENGSQSPYWHVLVKRRCKPESEERKSQIPRPLSVDENQLESLMSEANDQGMRNKEKTRSSMKRRSASFKELGSFRLKRNSSFKEAQEKGAIIGLNQRKRNDSVGNLSLSPSEISTCSEMPNKTPGILQRMFRRNKSFSERGSNDSSKIRDLVKKKMSIRNIFQSKKSKSELSLEKQMSESNSSSLDIFDGDMDLHVTDSAPNSPYSSQRFQRRYTSDNIFEQRSSTLPRRPSDIRKPHPLHLSQDHLSVQSLNIQNLSDHPKRPISPKPTGVTITRRNSNLSLPSSPIKESPSDTDGPFISSNDSIKTRSDSSSRLDSTLITPSAHELERRASKQSSTQDLEHYAQIVQGGEMTSSNSNDSGIQRDVSINSSNESIKTAQDSSIVRRCKSPSPRQERPKSEISVRWADLVETNEVTPIKRREGSCRKQRPKSDLGGSSLGEEMKPFGSHHSLLPYSSLQNLETLRSLEAMDQKPNKRRMSTPHPIKTRLERIPKKQKTYNPLIRSHSMPGNLDKICKRKRFPSSVGSSNLHSNFLRHFDDDSSSDDGSDFYADQISLHEKSLSARSSSNYLSTLEERPETDVLTYAEALWDHITMDPEELGFRAGDVIEVTDMTDKDWWWGAVDDQEGWFPATFVRLRVNQERVTDESSYKTGDKSEESSPLVRQVNTINEEQARENVINEIIHAERDYVKHLKDVVEGYIKHARKRTDMFSADRISVIFGNMEELYDFSTRFLEKVEKSFNEKSPPLSEIGHCFLDCSKEFEIYSDYCNNHPSACEELKELYRKQKYQHFFEACRLLQEMIEIPLEGFLLTPVQKICKYPLQLAELLKYTPSSHADHSNVKAALEAMKKIAALINERKRKMESIEKLAQWQTSVEDWQGPDLLELSSELIYSGEINKINSAGWSQERYFFLFDRQLVYCKKDLLKRNGFSYKGRVDLDDCEVIPLEDGKDTQYNVTVKNAWKLHEVARDKWYLLYSKTTSEKEKWLKAFTDERRQVKEDQENNFVPVYWKKMVLNKIKASQEKQGNRTNMSTTYQKDFIRGIPSHATLPRSYSKKVQKKKAWFIFGNKKTK